jgi:hypothetical protein
MRTRKERELLAGELFIAGECVPPGLYRQVGTEREVYFEQEDILPGSLDGRVACYERIQHTWRQLKAAPRA